MGRKAVFLKLFCRVNFAAMSRTGTMDLRLCYRKRGKLRRFLQESCLSEKMVTRTDSALVLNCC